MPNEIKQAVEWALQQTNIEWDGTQQLITEDMASALVDKVRVYFNTYNVGKRQIIALEFMTKLGVHFTEQSGQRYYEIFATMIIFHHCVVFT